MPDKKKDIRREEIISRLKSQKSVNRKELYTDIGMSKSRFSETIKELQDMGYEFDMTRRGYISLIASPYINETVYESLTTPIIRQWILLFRLTTISELKFDMFRTGYNDNNEQREIYKSMCSFYYDIFELSPADKNPYSMNLFNRDVDALLKAGEVSHNLMHIFKKFEAYDLFRISSKPFPVIINAEMAEKMLFALDFIIDKYEAAPALAARIKYFYEGYDFTARYEGDIARVSISNVYDRLSSLMSFSSNRKMPASIEELSQKTGIPANQIQKDLAYLKRNKYGQLFYDNKGFRIGRLLGKLTAFSSLYDIYKGTDHRMMFLPCREHLLFIQLRNLDYMWVDAPSYQSFKGPLAKMHYEIEDAWYDKIHGYS